MNKRLWTPLQIAWLVLAIFTAHNSMLALNNDKGYCAGMVCQRDTDCSAPCACDIQNSTCYDLGQSAR